jgi:hypothetical protein
MGAAAMSDRIRLPNRRSSENFRFECNGLRYTCTFSRFTNGQISDLFLSNHKTNSSADVNARDAAVTFSIAVQHGADPEIIRRALCRDAQGNPSGPLGAALDNIFANSGSNPVSAPAASPVHVMSRKETPT